jgi:hypothetical protein
MNDRGAAMRPPTFGPRATVVLAVLALVAVLAPAASASHQFTDVPNDHPFHSEIGIFRDTNITSGCTATEFCPQDFVRRQAMAAFVTRALGLVQRPGETGLRAVAGSRIAMIDDGSSLVGTFNGALEFSHNGFRVLRLEGNATSPNVIGGAAVNGVSSGVVAATVGGGGEAGSANRVTDNFGTVGGGLGNRAGDAAGTVSDRQAATVGGGNENTASGNIATVAGGDANTASGAYSSVLGGRLNTASGLAATVAGGSSNTASGDRGFASGRRAKATHEGSFVWGDASNFDIASAATNSFTARVTGGARFISAIDGSGVPTAGVNLAAGGGSWTSLSDAAAKRDFRPVDGAELLRRLAGLPISTWSYKSQDPSIRHMGPTAQDFRRLFGLGESDKGITTIDADGVALAAVQALHAENQALKRRNAAQIGGLKRENAALRRQNEALAARVAAIERALAKLGSSG